MFTKGMLNQMSDHDLVDYLENYQEELALNTRRLLALKRKQTNEPTWSYYDSFIDEEVTIDTLVECHEAVVQECEGYIKFFTDVQWERRGLNQTIKML